MRKIEKNNSCGSMAGNRKLFAAPISEIESVDFVDIKTKSVTMKEGFTFGEIQIDSFEMNSPFEDGYYKLEIKCLFTATKNVHDALFDRMTRQRFILKMVDNNNMVWLAGSLSEPLIFLWKHTGKASPRETHQYELTFRRNSTEPLSLTVL